MLTCTAFGQSTDTPPAVRTKVLLTGTVYDMNGAVILHAQLLARGVQGREYQAITNTDGVYEIELPVDVYKIEANAAGFCPKRVEIFRVRKPSALGDAHVMPTAQKPLDFVLDVPPSETPGVVGYRPCKQKTMIKEEPQIRKPEIFRSIAE